MRALASQNGSSWMMSGSSPWRSGVDRRLSVRNLSANAGPHLIIEDIRGRSEPSVDVVLAALSHDLWVIAKGSPRVTTMPPKCSSVGQELAPPVSSAWNLPSKVCGCGLPPVVRCTKLRRRFEFEAIVHPNLLLHRNRWPAWP